MTTGEGVVKFKGSPRYHFEEVLVSDIPTIQDYARNLGSPTSGCAPQSERAALDSLARELR